MKFTAGYLLGATTVVGIIGSFFIGVAGGAYAIEFINEKKQAGIAKVEDTSVTSIVRDIMDARKN